jgi:hypothetical protein
MTIDENECAAKILIKFWKQKIKTNYPFLIVGNVSFTLRKKPKISLKSSLIVPPKLSKLPKTSLN